MKKESKSWSINELRENFIDIDFPDYQREATVWPLGAKQLLIDSILRDFDVASLYFYKDSEGVLSCIDGRQRINAIISFLGDNVEDSADNKFPLRISHEIYSDNDHAFQELDKFRFEDVEAAVKAGDDVATAAKDKILGYKLTAIILSGSADPGEFNLQFTRLNLGAIINAGEKLHAMIGEMRNLCFDDKELGQHAFLEMVRIPIRRFAKEQVVAQALLQIFSIKRDESFAKARHFDLQKFFKRHVSLSSEDRELASELTGTFNALQKNFPDAGLYLKNRAIAVSTLLVAWKQRVFEDEPATKKYVEFLRTFLCRLRWQLERRSKVEVGMDKEYHYLLDFQRHVTQAAVEKLAVVERYRTLTDEFSRWNETGQIRGDEAFLNRVGEDPNDSCKKRDMAPR